MNYCCPICLESLSLSNHSLICKNRHCFDLAKSGYVNLLSQKNSSRSHGDNTLMVKARIDFLERGFYHVLIEALIDLLKPLAIDVLLDCGCGEGYYTRQIKAALKDTEVFGFDLSKDAIRYAASHDHASHYAIGSIFSLPVSDHCCEAVTSLFAPVALQEFYRVLKPGGYALIVTPGKRHLFDLKNQLYEHVYLNEEKLIQDERFQPVKTILVQDKIQLKNQDELQSLLKMTPYYYRTRPQDKEKLARLSSLECEIEFLIQLIQKN